jgi:hypothetical protein
MDFKNEFMNKDKALYTTACVKAMVHTAFAIYRAARERSVKDAVVSTIGAGTILCYDIAMIAANRGVLDYTMTVTTNGVGGGIFCDFPNPDSVPPGSADAWKTSGRSQWVYTTKTITKAVNMGIWTTLVMTPAMIGSAAADLVLSGGPVPVDPSLLQLPVRALGPINVQVNPLWATTAARALATGLRVAVIADPPRVKEFMAVESTLTAGFDAGIYIGMWATNMYFTTKFNCPAGLPPNAYSGTAL